MYYFCRPEAFPGHVRRALLLNRPQSSAVSTLLFYKTGPRLSLLESTLPSRPPSAHSKRLTPALASFKINTYKKKGEGVPLSPPKFVNSLPQSPASLGPLSPATLRPHPHSFHYTSAHFPHVWGPRADLSPALSHGTRIAGHEACSTAYSLPATHYLLPFSHYSALFCHSVNHNSFPLNLFRTLCAKHPGWGAPVRLPSPSTSLTSFSSATTQDLSRPLFVYSSQGGFLHEIAHTRIGTLRCGTLRSLCFAGSYGRTRRSGGSCRPCFARSACNACSPSGACTSGDASSPSISGVLLSPHAACPSCASRVCSHAHYARASGPSCPAGTACFSDL